MPIAVLQLLPSLSSVLLKFMLKHPSSETKEHRARTSNSSQAKNLHICLYFQMRLAISIHQHQFSHSVVSDSLWPHEPQHARPPSPSPTPGVYPNPCLSSWWCHPTISFSVIPFSSCPQSFPASESFPMSQLFTLAKVLEFQLQHQSLQWTPRPDLL